MTDVVLTLNGVAVRAEVEPRTSLADYVRDSHNLTGTHLGCEHGVCGACTVLIDGVPARSCITYAAACAHADVKTIEGLDDDDIMTELRAAFSREHALQCGFCTPGMLVSARDVVLRAPDDDEHAIRVAMSGNLCRCTGYVGIVRAIQSVVADRRNRGIKPIHGAGRIALGPTGAGHGGPIAPVAAPRTARPAVQAASADMADWQPQATFEQSFIVNHPIDEVWRFFADVPAVASCLPGASVEGDTTGHTVRGKMRVKVGPISPEFHGIAGIERNDADYSGTIRGSGQDANSSSATRGTVSYRLSNAGTGATKVDLSVGYRLTGPLAQFSRSDLMKDIAGRLVAAFARNVEARLSSPDAALRPAAELGAVSLFFSVVADRIRARLRRLFG
ncbi:MAG TPA: 2Fe-2S iron-sulfur cluster-binding protein [Vicinamibacterales bacterium]|nr:2Fe-2S iron-sulfur cluster-binding protein [Vicinamibacterales bacterium]